MPLLCARTSEISGMFSVSNFFGVTDTSENSAKSRASANYIQEIVQGLLSKAWKEQIERIEGDNKWHASANAHSMNVITQFLL